MQAKYRQYLLLNKNVLLAFAASIVISAIVAQLFADEQAYLNTTYTTIVDYVVYFTVFGTLYYIDNRKKYLIDGKTDRTALKQDLIKIVSSLGIAEIIYTIARWVLQYHLLTIDYDPYMASIISQGISTIIYMAILNLTVKATRLYKN